MMRRRSTGGALIAGAPMLGDVGARTEFWRRVLYSRCLSACFLCCALAAVADFGPKRVPIAISFAVGSAVQNTILFRVVRRSGTLPAAVSISDYAFALVTAVVLPAVFPWVLVILAVTMSLIVIGYDRRFGYVLVAVSAGPYLAACLWFRPEGWLPAYAIWLVCSLTTVSIIGVVATQERSIRARYSQLIDQLDVIVWEAPYGKPTTYVNEAVTSILGYAPQEWCAPGMWAWLVHPDDSGVIEAARLSSEQAEDHRIEYRIRTRDGSYRWVLELVTFTRSNGAPLLTRGVIVDIADRKRAERHAQELAALVRELPTSLTIVRPTIPGAVDSLRIVAANRRTIAELEMTEQDLTDMPSSVVMAWADSSDLREPLALAMKTGEVVEVPKAVRFSRSGVVNNFRLTVVPLLDGALGLAAEDVTERIRADEALRRQALHDPLTGLANRVLLHDNLSAALAAASGEGTVALLVMDLNQFKEVNDALGHHHGDRLLVELSRRLAALARPGDTAARLGGDEFALLLAGETSIEHARRTASTIVETFAKPVRIDGITLQSGVSVGIACSPDHGSDPDLLTQRADVAMYRAKSLSLGVELYRPEHDHNSVRRLTLITDLRKAADSGEIEPYYQPRVDLLSGNVIDVEALMRWRHPVEGMLLPGEFIELAEVSGEILRLTEEMMRMSCRDLGRISSPGRIGVAVNLSVRSLYDPTLSTMVERILAVSRLSADRLRLEITESELMEDPVLARSVLGPLCDRGVRLSVDDFGTGYSSLSYLRSLPVDELKIDRSFVTDLERGDSTLVRSIIDLGHNLGLRVVAEGVESGPVLRRLADLGCDSAQGYFISEPLAFDDLEVFLARDGDHYRSWTGALAPAHAGSRKWEASLEGR